MNSLVAIVCLLTLATVPQAVASDRIHAKEPETTKEAKAYAKKMTRQIEEELKDGDFLPLAKRYDWALDHIIERTTRELKKRGHHDLADEATAAWNFHYRGFLTRMVANERDIGDHKGLADWLTAFYLKVELLLGREVCKALHISDLHTLNHGLAVIFRPCTFSMDNVPYTRKAEYQQHFNGDFAPTGFYGVLPVLVYWVIDIPCMVGTAGLAALLCGPAASVGEYLTYRFVGPKISDRIFDRVCGKEQK
jgi:hypothetical protein